VLGSCARLEERPDLPRELALEEAERGVLQEYGERIEAQLASGESAFWLLDRNDLAMHARLALTDSATASLDIQYFIWQEDATGFLLAGRVLKAAQRGVKVRLLLDDFGIATERSEILRLDAHPNIEVRVFNPWGNRSSRLVKTMEFIFRWIELNRRMHNKTYIADNRFAIIGGRNIGDRYFGVFEKFVQNDLDVLVAGSITGETSASFDAFWNDSRSYPMSAFSESPDTIQPLEQTASDIENAVATNGDVLRAFPVDSDWRPFLEDLAMTPVRARGTVIYDSPEILEPTQIRLYPQFKELVASARSEVLISSPYFIPDRDFRDLIRALIGRGVRVAIVTNSLESNNHTVAHTGYRHWRREMLAAGAELYELRADAAAIDLYKTPPVTPGALGLHTKAVVVDGAACFVGSPNVDPRSMELNTEIGVVVESEELSARLRELIMRDMAPENAWAVAMDDEGWLTWTSERGTLTRQPARGFKQRVIEFFLNLIPLKKQA
jgi:putative cardiolipin synthase